MLLNDETRSIVIGKIINRYNLNEQVSYYKFELSKNGTANIRVPTLRNETSFNLEVNVCFHVFEHFIIADTKNISHERNDSLI